MKKEKSLRGIYNKNRAKNRLTVSLKLNCSLEQIRTELFCPVHFGQWKRCISHDDVGKSEKSVWRLDQEENHGTALHTGIRNRKGLKYS